MSDRDLLDTHNDGDFDGHDDCLLRVETFARQRRRLQHAQRRQQFSERGESHHGDVETFWAVKDVDCEFNPRLLRELLLVSDCKVFVKLQFTHFTHDDVDLFDDGLCETVYLFGHGDVGQLTGYLRLVT